MSEEDTSKPFICRNCGEFCKHSWCKRDFPSDERNRIDNLVRVQLERRAMRTDSEKRQTPKNRTRRSCNEDPDFPQYGPIPPVLCGNCADFGHPSCSAVFSESEKGRISELFKMRKKERALQMKERQRDFDRRKMAYLRTQPDVQERERIYKLSKSYRDS